MPPPAADFIEVFRVFARAEVTLDLDLVHDRRELNAQRLQRALATLDSRSRLPGQQKRRPLAADLAGPGHPLLPTRAGPLDLLDTVAPDEGCAALLPASEAIALEPGPGLTPGYSPFPHGIPREKCLRQG